IEYVLGGVGPARVGTGSALFIAAAGLYLSYRYILRGRSIIIFTAAFIIGTIACSLAPLAATPTGVRRLWELAKLFPGGLPSLVSSALSNSDAAFAAVFPLARPGTDPLPPRGRRIFLVVAGPLGAGLHSPDPGIPAATLGLCATMPFSGWFDWAFGRRSWLNV